MIKEYIADGKIVPMEVTVQLLENAMMDKDKGKGRFLIDGRSILSAFCRFYMMRRRGQGLSTQRLSPQDGPGYPL